MASHEKIDKKREKGHLNINFLALNMYWSCRAVSTIVAWDEQSMGNSEKKHGVVACSTHVFLSRK